LFPYRVHPTTGNFVASFRNPPEFGSPLARTP
jgi:hypothetical protein